MKKLVGSLLLVAGLLVCQATAAGKKAADKVGDPVDPNFDSLKMAIQDLAATYPADYEVAPLVRELREFERAYAQPGVDHDGFMLKYGEFARGILVRNPILKQHPILFVVRNQYKPDHHNTETMFQTGEINTRSFQGGGALKVIDFAAGGKVRTILASEKGVIRDPEVHFDGKRILFSMRKDIEDNYHLYEINTDGTGLRQITSAKGVFEIDPLYLPDDSIICTSSREPKYCMCNRHIMGNMFRMDPDGANIVQISKNTLFDGHGWLMPDGRVMYYRWEYVDRNFGDAQGLWTMNPDGTQHLVYWKNNTGSPGAVLDPHMIPGTQRVLCIFSSCHDRPWGALAIVDRRLGIDGSEPVIQTWPADAIKLVNLKGGIDTFKQVGLKFEDPFPLSDKYFICSRMTGNGEEMGLYLADIFGNVVLLHVEAPGCFDAMPLARRARPAALPVKRDYENKEGLLYIQNVYLGTHMAGVKSGAVKYLRVVEAGEKRAWTHQNWNGQGAEAPGMNWHDFGNKNILGTVPVEADGSAYFAAPSDKFLFFQLLDEDGMMIQSMRSGMVVQSGETTGCIGCHEERRGTPPVPKTETLMALKRAPSRLEGWYGPPRFFSYMTEVQPVFDKHCIGCHDYGKPGAKLVNLSGDRGLIFNNSYVNLWSRNKIKVVGAGPAQVQEAYSWGSHASPLVERLRSGPCKVNLSKEEMDRIVTWLDINAPYYPTYNTSFPDNLYGRSPLNGQQLKKLGELTGLNLNDRQNAVQVSFDRPEKSPCLEKFSDRNDPACREAVAIIEEGRKALVEKSSAEMADFKPCQVDQTREDKYALRLSIEQRNREAIRTGKKLYDRDMVD